MISANICNDGQYRLLKLRDPKGKTLIEKGGGRAREAEWTGPFSDSDKEVWTLELQAEMEHNPDDIDDGVFCMKIDEFAYYFDSVYFCHYRNSHKLSTTVDFNPANQFAYFQFNIVTKGDYYFGVSQPDKRQKKFQMNHKMGMMSVFIFQVIKGKAIYVKAKGGETSRDIWCAKQCGKGQYIAVVSTLWNTKSLNENEYSFWIYGQDAIQISKIKEKESKIECHELMADAFIDYVSPRLTFILGFKKEEPSYFRREHTRLHLY